jgi:putative membrane protein
MINPNDTREEKPGTTPRPPDINSDDRIFLAWQRSHMANERTFLSWSRTAISLLAFGFVIERFDIFLEHILRLSGGAVTPTRPSHMIYLGLFSFLLAGFVTVAAGFRFLRTRRNINQGGAEYSILPDVLVIVSVVVIIVIVILLSLPRLLELHSVGT